MEEEKYIKELEVKNKDNEEIINQLKNRIKDIEKVMELKKNINVKSIKVKPTERINDKNYDKSCDKSLNKSNSISEKLSKSSKSPLIQSSPRTKKIKCILPSKRSTSAIKESSSSKELKSKTKQQNKIK